MRRGYEETSKPASPFAVRAQRAAAVGVDDDILSPEELAEIEEARAEIRKGDWVTLGQLKSENGL